ncbi:uncharacterized protein LOC112592163 [Melanaphis sacchari]|uniref:uncharacterized protein LOC112592163 n=1 Tax=Melanaphis sacchari TaxID=742174 RepID=UPI000DC14DE2|nr:uncharacterized protein LOC112592163 [Melanaphis sacchari]
MDGSVPKIDSLYNIALNQTCQSITKDSLVTTLNSLHPRIGLQIIWKILHVNNDDKDYEYNYSILNEELYSDELDSIYRGYCLAHLTHNNKTIGRNYFGSEIFMENVLSQFATIQQTKFVDHFNFSDHFDLELLFKLLDVTSSRGQLFTIFQICVQIKGIQFPMNLSNEWIQFPINDKSQQIISRHIDQGIKFGVFLSDSGWLYECANVLLHTFTIITTLWQCVDRNLELLKTIQCLSKWLLALSKLHEFDEAIKVLKHTLHIINLIEMIEKRSFSIANACVAVSQYYYLILEYDTAWLWAVKSVHELRDTNNNVLKLSVISHAIKISSVLNKFGTAKKLINQLRTYNTEICNHIHVDMLLNEAVYSMKTEQEKECRKNYFIALDTTRNLFGYHNLHTAFILTEYAYSRYKSFNSIEDYEESMQIIFQIRSILKTLGISSNHLLFMYTLQLQSLITKKTLSFMINLVPNYHFTFTLGFNKEVLKKKILKKFHVLHLRVLSLTIDVVGLKSMLTAKSYSILGDIYKTQKKYKKSEKMYLKAIEIKKSILDENNAEIALSYRDLGRLNLKRSNKLKKFMASRKIWLHKVLTEVDEDLLEHGLSVENFKSIVIDSSCDNNLIEI